MRMRTRSTLYAFILLSATAVGQQWSQLTSGTTNPLMDVDFGNTSTGVVVGAGSMILSTNDGGATWTQRTAAIPDIHLKSVAFSSPDVVWAVGSQETLLKSVDGGVTWTVISSTTNPISYNGIYFATPQLGYIAGGGGLVGVVKRTTDGGATWSTTSLAMEMMAVHANTSGHAWTCGSRGVIHHTANGVDWEQQTEQGPNMLSNVGCIYMLNDLEGWVGGSYQTIHHTVDGGENWVETPSGTNSGITGIYFSDDQHGWAVSTASIIGGYPIRRTMDGSTWTEHNLYLPYLWSVRFLNPAFGWAVGDQGTILRYGEGTVGVAEQEPTTPLLIAPNPVTDHLNYLCEEPVTEARIHNAAGQEVMRHNGPRSMVDVGTLAPGAYSIRIVTEQGLRMGRFIKE